MDIDAASFRLFYSLSCSSCFIHCQHVPRCCSHLLFTLRQGLLGSRNLLPAVSSRLLFTQGIDASAFCSAPLLPGPRAQDEKEAVRSASSLPHEYKKSSETMLNVKLRNMASVALRKRQLRHHKLGPNACQAYRPNMHHVYKLCACHTGRPRGPSHTRV